MTISRFRLPAAICVTSVFVTGCTLPEASETGVRIGDETLKQFEAGVTTEDWLVAILGPPSSQSPVEGIENTKVLRYALGESAGGLGALFSGQATKNTAVVYFIITDGIMTRYWADRAIDRTLLGTPVEESSGQKQQ